MKNTPILSIKNLSVSFKNGKNLDQVLHTVSLELNKGEILGIVGESGSGKSITSLAILGLLPKKTSVINSGEIVYNNKNLISFTDYEFSGIRGKEIAMIFQEPMSSLNPSMSCGKQVAEILLTHNICSKKTVKLKVLELFEKVKLPNPERVYNAYPHEISGGQKQRVMIAMAIACNPKILIADEPTTALDVTVQKEIVELLKDIQSQSEMSVIFISHDLSLVAEIADRVVVMYKGQIVEKGNTHNVFTMPKNNYTKALIQSKPPLDTRYKRLPTIQDIMNNTLALDVISKSEREKQLNKLYENSPILEVKNIDKVYFSKTGLFSKQTGFKAVNNVSFKLYEGETLGLVGESGCGKSTLGNLIALLDRPTSGSIFYKGKDITRLRKNEVRLLRKEIQLIFQDPYSSLNPRLTIGQAIMEPMKVLGIYNSTAECKEKAIQLLENVGLDANHFYRYPHEFSGGQRQRIGIARAIAVNPKLIICDESVSALDISVQAQVLNLLNDLKEEFGFSYIFISHDLAVVKYMSDQLLVMNNGELEETGIADSIYENPQKKYTKKLINAIPKGL
jgi:peptide/nickel transport system ATP-binding protein